MIRTLQISNILALIVTVGFNYLSNTGFLNGETMASVSDRYHNYFTPAGYAFSVWGLIYLALTGFAVHQARGLFSKAQPPAIVGKIGWLFVWSCLANCLWIIAWLKDYTGASILVMALLLFLLMTIAFRTRMELDLVRFRVVAFEWWPFAIYIGWISVALFANITAYMTKMGWDKLAFSPKSWTFLMITLATAANLYLTWSRNLRESASVAAWGLIAVGVANWDGTRSIAYAAIMAAVVLLISGGIHGYRNRGQHFIFGNKSV